MHNIALCNQAKIWQILRDLLEKRPETLKIRQFIPYNWLNIFQKSDLAQTARPIDLYNLLKIEKIYKRRFGEMDKHLALL